MEFSLESFAALTVGVLTQQGGVADYAPTLAIVATQDIRVLTGVPEDVDDRAALLDWFVQQELGWEPFFFGVRSGEGQVTVGYCEAGACQFALISEREGEFERVEIDQPDWWCFAPERSRH